MKNLVKQNRNQVIDFGHTGGGYNQNKRPIRFFERIRSGKVRGRESKFLFKLWVKKIVRLSIKFQKLEALLETKEFENKSKLNSAFMEIKFRIKRLKIILAHLQDFELSADDDLKFKRKDKVELLLTKIQEVTKMIEEQLFDIKDIMLEEYDKNHHIFLALKQKVSKSIRSKRLAYGLFNIANRLRSISSGFISHMIPEEKRLFYFFLVNRWKRKSLKFKIKRSGKKIWVIKPWKRWMNNIIWARFGRKKFWNQRFKKVQLFRGTRVKNNLLLKYSKGLKLTFLKKQGRYQVASIFFKKNRFIRFTLKETKAWKERNKKRKYVGSSNRGRFVGSSLMKPRVKIKYGVITQQGFKNKRIVRYLLDEIDLKKNYLRYFYKKVIFVKRGKSRYLIVRKLKSKVNFKSRFDKKSKFSSRGKVFFVLKRVILQRRFLRTGLGILVIEKLD